MANQIPQINASLTHEVANSDEFVVFDQAGNELLVLNDTAAAIWLLVDGQRNTDEIIAEITAVLAVEQEVVAAEVEHFSSDLAARNLLSWVDA